MASEWEKENDLQNLAYQSAKETLLKIMQPIQTDRNRYE